MIIKIKNVESQKIKSKTTEKNNQNKIKIKSN